MKTCAKCNTTKPLSEFYKDKRASDGLYSSCKKCSNETSKKWRCENKEYFSDYYQANKERISKYLEKYRNSEHGKAYLAAWQEANREHVKKRKHIYYETHKEEHARNRAAWFEANPLARKTIMRNRRARERSVGGTLSKDLPAKLMKLQKGKCACCGKSLGNDYHLDHIMPIALGGTNTDDNIQLLRAECNLRKSKKHPVDFMQERGLLL